MAFLSGTAGNNLLNGTANADVILGRAGDDTINGLAGDDALFGNAGNDTISGGAGDDLIFGGRGNDVLRGGLGDDRLEGGAGDDNLDGGRGQDDLVGGLGADTFDFNNIADSGLTPTTWDVIEDFDRAQGDKVDLSGLNLDTTGRNRDDIDVVHRGGDTFLTVNTDRDRAPEFVLKFEGNVTINPTADLIL